MTVLLASAPGKINLCLFVGEPRADGLHPVVTVLQAVTLADELRLEPAPAGATGDEVLCPGVEGPNLAADALAAYREAAGWDAPAQRLTIVKRVPVAAGMGGGSGDAAAALRLAAHAAGRPGDPLLYELAAALGSDVPFQLAPGRALATHTGTHVEALPGVGDLPLAFVIVPVDAGLSAAEVYREADRLGLARPPEELTALERSVRTAALAGPLPLELLHNDLELAARSLCPAIELALAAVSAAGAAHAMVTGSGPTVVGLFEPPDGPERARAAVATLRASHPRAVAVAPAVQDIARVRHNGQA